MPKDEKKLMFGKKQEVENISDFLFETSYAEKNCIILNPETRLFYY